MSKDIPRQTDRELKLAQALEPDGVRTPGGDLFRGLADPEFRYHYIKAGKKTQGEINARLKQTDREAVAQLVRDYTNQQLNIVVSGQRPRLIITSEDTADKILSLFAPPDRRMKDKPFDLVIGGEWRCKECSTLNAGGLMVCRKCGHRRSND